MSSDGKHEKKQILKYVRNISINWISTKKYLFLILIILAIKILTKVYIYCQIHGIAIESTYLIVHRSEFNNFNNETGRSILMVPNIIHFLRFDQAELKFTDAVCILAATLNHKPDRLIIHINSKNLTGKHWEYLLHVPEFKNIYEIKNIAIPPTIFGQKLSTGWHKPHGSDVTRIRILMQYGGIFLDNDSYVVQNLTKYRYYEMVLGWDEGQYLGSQVLIAHPNARFLKLWLESYRDNYHSELWYYNAGERPTKTVLWHKPELVHRVKLKFGVHMLAHNLYKTDWKEWRSQEAVHLLLNHRSYLDKEHYEEFPEFNDENIFNCNVTFCHMARDVYFQ